MLQCSNYQPQTSGCGVLNPISGAIRLKRLKERPLQGMWLGAAFDALLDSLTSALRQKARNKETPSAQWQTGLGSGYFIRRTRHQRKASHERVSALQKKSTSASEKRTGVMALT